MRGGREGNGGGLKPYSLMCVQWMYTGGPAMTSTSRNRAERISLRTTSEHRHLIERAAEVTGKTMTSFILDAAYQEAQRALTGQHIYMLDDEQWATFLEALDAPVSDNPRLRDLLQSPTILD